MILQYMFHLFVRGDGFTKDIYENSRKEVNWEVILRLVWCYMQHHLITLATFVLPMLGLRGSMEQLFEHSPDTLYAEG